MRTEADVIWAPRNPAWSPVAGRIQSSQDHSNWPCSVQMVPSVSGKQPMPQGSDPSKVCLGNCVSLLSGLRSLARQSNLEVQTARPELASLEGNKPMNLIHLKDKTNTSAANSLF